MENINNYGFLLIPVNNKKPRLKSYWHILFKAALLNNKGMEADKKQLEDVASFIKEHRSNEIAFEKLYAKLVKEINSPTSDEAYKNNLVEVKEKAAEEYSKAKETGGTAWPEFEKFVTGFEKAVVQATHS